jgi:hypothetical protein
MAASVLAIQGCPVDTAFAKIATARGCSVPDTAKQSTWLAKLFPNDER